MGIQMKQYLLIFDSTFGELDRVVFEFKQIDVIRDVRTCISGSLFIKSTVSASEIAKQLIAKYQNCRFFITEISANRQGWLPKSLWEFIKDEQQ